MMVVSTPVGFAAASIAMPTVGVGSGVSVVATAHFFGAGRKQMTTKKNIKNRTLFLVHRSGVFALTSIDRAYEALVSSS